MACEHLAALNRVTKKATEAFNKVHFPGGVPQGGESRKMAVAKAAPELRKLSQVLLKCFEDAKMAITKEYEEARSFAAQAWDTEPKPNLACPNPLANVTKPAASEDIKGNCGEALPVSKVPLKVNSGITGPAVVSVSIAVVDVPIYIGCVPKAVTKEELQGLFGGTLVGRYGTGEFGFIKLLLPDSEVDLALSKVWSVSGGHKLRVARWKSKGRRSRSAKSQTRKISSAAGTASCNSSVEERARFVAEFLAAEARPSGSPRGRQLYSQVVSRDKSADHRRMQSMEMAIYDVKRLLERLTQSPM